MIEFHAGEGIAIPRTLRYGVNHSEAAKRNQVIPRADIARVYFEMGNFVSLTDESSSEIQWTDNNGEIRIHLPPALTLAEAGTHTYEIRVKMLNGKFYTAEKGDATIKSTLIGNPT